MKKLTIIIGVSTFILVLLHFVPVYSSNGYIDHGKNGESVTCIGYLGNQPHYYRIITNGMGDFNSDKSKFEKDANTFNNTVCGIEPTTLRLYIL